MKRSRKLQISSHLLFVYISNQDRKWRMSELVFSRALVLPNKRDKPISCLLSCITSRRKYTKIDVYHQGNFLFCRHSSYSAAFLFIYCNSAKFVRAYRQKVKHSVDSSVKHGVMKMSRSREILLRFSFITNIFLFSYIRWLT